MMQTQSRQEEAVSTRGGHGPADVDAASRRRDRRASTRHFVQHYGEMVVAMFLGMAILGLPALAALGLAGVTSSELERDAPAVWLLGMGVTMTLPMVAWMRFRGHGVPACRDMAAAMLLPTAGVIALLGSGLTDDVDALVQLEHVAMFPSMLVAMLLRRDEYTGAAGLHAGH